MAVGEEVADGGISIAQSAMVGEVAVVAPSPEKPWIADEVPLEVELPFSRALGAVCRRRCPWSSSCKPTLVVRRRDGAGRPSAAEQPSDSAPLLILPAGTFAFSTPEVGAHERGDPGRGPRRASTSLAEASAGERCQ